MPYDEVVANVGPAMIEESFRRSYLVPDVTREEIGQALIGSRPIASFATAAGAGLAPNPVAPAASFAGGLAEANPDSGVPRAMIPMVEELGVGSGVGSDCSAGNGFDLASGPATLVAQYFPCD